MKKIITSIILCGLLVCTSVSCKNRQESDEVSQDRQLAELVNDFRGNEEFRVVNLGGLATSILKGTAGIAGKYSDDPQVTNVLKSINDVQGLNVVTYGDCEDSLKAAFNARLSGILNDDNLVMEAKDGEDVVKIYGFEDKSKDGALKDIVISVPSEGVLLCIKGSVDFNKLVELAK